VPSAVGGHARRSRSRLSEKDRKPPWLPRRLSLEALDEQGDGGHGLDQQPQREKRRDSAEDEAARERLLVPAEGSQPCQSEDRADRWALSN